MTVLFDRHGRRVAWGKASTGAVELTAKSGSRRRLGLTDVSSLSREDARSAMESAMAGLGDRRRSRKDRALLRRAVHLLDERLEAIAASEAPRPRREVVALVDRVAAARDALGLTAMDHRPPEYRQRALPGAYERKAPPVPSRTPPRVDDPALLAGRVEHAKRAIYGADDNDGVQAKAAKVREAMRGAA